MIYFPLSQGAISKTYSYLSPDMWPEVKLTEIPFQEFSDYLSKNRPKNISSHLLQELSKI